MRRDDFPGKSTCNEGEAVTTTYPTITVCRHCRTQVERSPSTQTATIFTGTDWFHVPTGLRTCDPQPKFDMLRAVLDGVPLADPLTVDA